MYITIFNYHVPDMIISNTPSYLLPIVVFHFRLHHLLFLPIAKSLTLSEKLMLVREIINTEVCRVDGQIFNSTFKSLKMIPVLSTRSVAVTAWL